MCQKSLQFNIGERLSDFQALLSFSGRKKIRKLWTLKMSTKMSFENSNQSSRYWKSLCLVYDIVNGSKFELVKNFEIDNWTVEESKTEIKFNNLANKHWFTGWCIINRLIFVVLC